MRIARATPLALAALCALAGCRSYVGGARPIDPARVTAEAGWMTVAPIPEIRQTTPDTCGPAALSMLAGRWGVPLSLEQAVQAVPEPSEKGVKLGDLRAAARELGLLAFALRGDRDVLIHEVRAGRPIIVGLLLQHRMRRVRSHYEVVVALRPQTGEVATIDPASGFRVRRFDDLDDEWGAAGHPALVVVGPLSSAREATHGAIRPSGRSRYASSRTGGHLDWKALR